MTRTVSVIRAAAVFCLGIWLVVSDFHSASLGGIRARRILWGGMMCMFVGEAMGRAAEVVAPSSSIRTDGGCPVLQVNDLSRSLAAFDPISTSVVVVEMSKMSWLVSGVVPGVERRAGCDGTVAIDRAVAHRGGACWPADQADCTGL